MTPDAGPAGAATTWGEPGATTLLALGGTISMRIQDGLAVPALPAASVGALLDPSGGHRMHCVDLARVGGSEVGFGLLAALSRAVAGAQDAGALGVVVTCGTDAIEETSAWLTLTGPWLVPVVVTGSMLPGGEPGSDAPANLALACSVVDAGIGPEPVVAFAGRVWLGRAVQKVSGLGRDAFATPGREPVAARAEDGSLTPLRAYPPASTLGAPGPRLHPVPLLLASLDDDGEALRHVGAGREAVVVAANGAGNLPPAMATVATRLLAEGTLVALASRTADATAGAAYGYPGGGGQLARAGAVLADGLTPHQTRVLLTLATSHDQPTPSPREALLTHLESLT